VALLSANIQPMLAAHFAVPMAGAVLNTINMRLDIPTIAYILEHCEARLLIVDAEWLAADVAGYSHLMHRDEEATHTKLREILAEAVEPAIEDRGGRIVKSTEDGLLAEFPGAVQAVRAAVQFQLRAKELTSADAEDSRIAFRVGVNIDDVIVEPHDIFGDGVNIAARLEGIAEPGGFCILSSIYEHARGKVDVEFVDLGEQNLRYIDRAVWRH
jgi:class 3 adenylate cyclase